MGHSSTAKWFDTAVSSLMRAEAVRAIKISQQNLELQIIYSV
jgi:hypothetical protein